MKKRKQEVAQGKRVAQGKSSSAAAWSFTGAFTLIGIGLGLYFNQLLPGLFLGIGFGLLISMILRYRQSSR